MVYFMDTTTLFTAALGLAEPWYVTSTDFKDAPDGLKELHIYIDFKRDPILNAQWKAALIQALLMILSNTLGDI